MSKMPFLLVVTATLFTTSAWSQVQRPRRVITEPTPEQGSKFGSAVAIANCDREARDELLIGAIGSGGHGRVYIYGNVENPIVLDPIVLSPPNPQQGEEFGGFIDVGDLNGDGEPDVVIGSRLYDAPSGSLVPTRDAGRVIIYFGPDFTETMVVMEPTESIGQEGVQERGPSQDAWFGSVLHVSNINQEGPDDLLVGAPFSSRRELAGDPPILKEALFAGEVFLFLDLEDGAFSEKVALSIPDFDKSDENGDRSFEKERGSSFGFTVFSGNFDNLGDVRDIIIGAPGPWGGPPRMELGADEGPGRFYVFPDYNRPSIFLKFQETMMPHNDGPEPGARYAYMFDVADLNADGLDEILLGGGIADVISVADAGEAFIFEGSRTEPYTIIRHFWEPFLGGMQGGPETGAQFGDFVLGADIDGDGRGELLVTAITGSSPNDEGAPLEHAGEVFVYFPYARPAKLPMWIREEDPQAFAGFGFSPASGFLTQGFGSSPDAYEDVAIGARDADVRFGSLNGHEVLVEDAGRVVVLFFRP